MKTIKEHMNELIELQDKRIEKMKTFEDKQPIPAEAMNQLFYLKAHLLQVAAEINVKQSKTPPNER